MRDTPEPVSAGAESEDANAAIAFRILGPVVVRAGGQDVVLSGPAQKALLALLLLHAGRAVPNDVIAESLWGSDAEHSVKRLQMAVARLRKALKPLSADDRSVLRTADGGYWLDVAPGALDAHVFEDRVRRGRAALESGDAVRAARLLRDAEALWRGPALAEMPYASFARDEARRLDELRLDALEVRVNADLSLDRHAELVGELEVLVAANPSRDRFAAQLMLALYRCGRQLDALDTYQRARRRLDKLGLEPGPHLQDLQARILNQDPSLLRIAPTPLPLELEVAAAIPLAGRRAEYARLRRHWDRARDGAAAMVAVTGPRGIGKTRLAAELAVGVHQTGANVHLVSGVTRAKPVSDALSTSSPTLLVVDSVEAVGGSVLDALRSASRSVPVLTILIADEEKSLAGLPVVDVLGLAPLDEPAVAEIARGYLPRGGGAELPAGRLLAVSGGVPAEAHAQAREWARRESVRRVEIAADKTAAGRAGLRSLEAELAEEVVGLRTSGAPTPHDGRETVVCPFKGLAPFDVDDARYFFGRERLTGELVARLVGTTLLGVVGPSGSGKSSVMRAGLLPALSEGVLPGSEHWRPVILRPGEHPPQDLGPIAGDGRFVLAVDQFEEVFTTCRDETERAGFIAGLMRLAHEGRGIVVLALRADQYGRCAEHPELSRVLAANHVLVPPLTRDELRRAIECPAEQAGLIVEPGLTDRLMADVERQPGGLPLLSTALLELWQRRERRRLRLAAYEETGGVSGAVARLAESAFLGLDAGAQPHVRDVLTRLVSEGREGGVERRRMRQSELASNPRLAAVAQALADARLLTVSDGTIELAHEALLREWPRLAGWIAEDREALRIHRAVGEAAREWEHLNRDDGALYRGTPLRVALDWREHRQPVLDDLEREFLDASQAARVRETTTRRHRLELLVGVLAAGLVIIGVAALIAVHQKRVADGERDTARSRSIALESVQEVGTDPALALRLAMWADQVKPTPESAAAMRQAILAYHQLRVLRADSQTANTAAYNPAGTRIVTGGSDGTARLFDAHSGQLLARFDPHRGALQSAHFSPRGDRIALGFQKGALFITDAQLHQPREALQVDKSVTVYRLAFSHDGAKVAAALTDGTARVVALDRHAPVSQLGTAGATIRGIDIDPAGRVVTSDDDGVVKLWNPDGSGPLTLGHGTGVEPDVAFSPDGKLVLGVDENGVAQLWNARSGAEITTIQVDQRPLNAVVFSPDGHRFATASDDGSVRVWDTTSALNAPLDGPGASELFDLRGQLSRVLDVNFGATSDRLISAGEDGRAIEWDAGGVTTFVQRVWEDSMDLSADGRRVLTGDEAGVVRVRDARTGRVLAHQRGTPGFDMAHFSPRGDEAVWGRYGDSTVMRWPLGAKRAIPVAHLGPAPDAVVARFDATGQRIVYARYSRPGSLAVVDLRSRRVTKFGGMPRREQVDDVGMSGDGRYVAAAGGSGVLHVWRFDSPAKPFRRLVGHHAQISTLAAGPGDLMVTTGDDRTVRVWNVATGHQTILRGHTDELLAARFMSDGRRVISTSGDGTVRLWNAGGGDPLAVLESGPVPVYDLAVAKGNLIATADGRQLVRLFRCEVCGSDAQLRAISRSLHPRQLTADERRRFLAQAR